jgi:Na+/proline symporter
LIVSLSLLTYVAAQFQGAGITFVEAFDMQFEWALLLGAGIVIFYTLLGGFWAVSLTDTVQGMLMVFAALLLPIIAVARAGVGDIAASLATGMDGEAIGWWTASTKGLPAGAALGFVLGLLGIGLGYPGQPHVVNRYMAIRDERSLVVGRRISMLWAFSVYSGMIALGWGMRVLDPSLQNGEDAFVHATELLLSPVFAGMMIAALLSAIMSTVDSQLLVAASTISYDLIGQAGVIPPDHAAQLRRSRLTVLAVSLGAVLVALWVDESIFSSVLFAWTAMGLAFGPVLLIIVLVGRPSANAVIASMLAGFVLSVAAHLWPQTNGGAVERVLPFVIALAIAWPSARQAGAQPRAGR